MIHWMIAGAGRKGVDAWLIYRKPNRKASSVRTFAQTGMVRLPMFILISRRGAFETAHVTVPFAAVPSVLICRHAFGLRVVTMISRKS